VSNYVAGIVTFLRWIRKERKRKGRASKLRKKRREAIEEKEKKRESLFLGGEELPYSLTREGGAVRGKKLGGEKKEDENGSKEYLAHGGGSKGWSRQGNRISNMKAPPGRGRQSLKILGRGNPCILIVRREVSRRRGGAEGRTRGTKGAFFTAKREIGIEVPAVGRGKAEPKESGGRGEKKGRGSAEEGRKRGVG